MKWTIEHVKGKFRVSFGCLTSEQDTFAEALATIERTTQELGTWQSSNVSEISTRTATKSSSTSYKPLIQLYCPTSVSNQEKVDLARQLSQSYPDYHVVWRAVSALPIRRYKVNWSSILPNHPNVLMFGEGDPDGFISAEEMITFLEDPKVQSADPESRKQAAQLLRKYVTGIIPNGLITVTVHSQEERGSRSKRNTQRQSAQTVIPQSKEQIATHAILEPKDEASLTPLSIDVYPITREVSFDSIITALRSDFDESDKLSILHDLPLTRKLVTSHPVEIDGVEYPVLLFAEEHQILSEAEDDFPLWFFSHAEEELQFLLERDTLNITETETLNHRLTILTLQDYISILDNKPLAKAEVKPFKPSVKLWIYVDPNQMSLSDAYDACTTAPWLQNLRKEVTPSISWVRVAKQISKDGTVVKTQPFFLSLPHKAKTGMATVFIDPAYSYLLEKEEQLSEEELSKNHSGQLLQFLTDYSNLIIQIKPEPETATDSIPADLEKKQEKPMVWVYTPELISHSQFEEVIRNADWTESNLGLVTFTHLHSPVHLKDDKGQLFHTHFFYAKLPLKLETVPCIVFVKPEDSVLFLDQQMFHSEDAVWLLQHTIKHKKPSENDELNLYLVELLEQEQKKEENDQLSVCEAQDADNTQQTVPQDPWEKKPEDVWATPVDPTMDLESVSTALVADVFATDPNLNYIVVDSLPPFPVIVSPIDLKVDNKDCCVLLAIRPSECEHHKTRIYTDSDEILQYLSPTNSLHKLLKDYTTKLSKPREDKTLSTTPQIAHAQDSSISEERLTAAIQDYMTSEDGIDPIAKRQHICTKRLSKALIDEKTLTLLGYTLKEVEAHKDSKRRGRATAKSKQLAFHFEPE